MFERRYRSFIQKAMLLTRFRLLILAITVLASLSSFRSWSGEASHHPASARSCGEGSVFPVIEDRKVGFIDAEGHMVIPPAFTKPGRPVVCRCFDSDRMLSPHMYCASLTYHPKGYDPDAPNSMDEGMKMEFVPPFSDGVAIVMKEKQLGFLRQDGTLLFPPQFDRVCSFDHGITWASKQGKHMLLDDHGRILARGYDAWRRLTPNAFGVKRGSKWGLLDQRGTVLISPRFDGIKACRSDLVVVSLAGKWGLVNLAEDTLVLQEHDDIKILSDDRIAIKINKAWRIADAYGRFLASDRYDDVDAEFSEGLLAVKKESRWGYIDEWGKLIVAAKYEVARDFHEARAAVKLNGQYGFVDPKGAVVVKTQYDDVGDFHDGVCVVSGRDADYSIECGLIDTFGKTRLRIGAGCRGIGPWKGGVAVAWFDAGKTRIGNTKTKLESNQKSIEGVVDQFGKLVLEPRFSNVVIAGPSRYLVWNAETVQLVDATGRRLGLDDRPYVWAAADLAEGMRAVAIGKDVLSSDGFSSHGRKYGFVNRWGNVVIEPVFDYVESFSNGLARVNVGGGRTIDGEIVGGKWGYVDRTGRRIWPVWATGLKNDAIPKPEH